MKADPKVARRLMELSDKAAAQRQALENEIAELKGSKKISVGSIGVKALKTASLMGLKDPKMVGQAARLIVFPALVGVGRFFLKHGSPRRAVGLALFALGATGIVKGIEFDNRKNKESRPSDEDSLQSH